jgi:hypothetical protein
MTKQAKLRPVSPGIPFAVLSSMTSTFEADDDLPFDVTLEIEFDDSVGRFVCVSMTCARAAGGPPIGTEEMRRVNVSGLIRTALIDATTSFLTPVNPKQNPEWNEAWHALNTDPHAIREGGPTDLTLRATAIIYSRAFAAGEPPVETVARELGITRATAARWVATARNDRGYLRKTDPRRART